MLWYFLLFIYKFIFIYNLDGQRPDFTAVEMCSFPGKLYLTIMMLCLCFLFFFENDFMTKSNIKNIEYEGRSIDNVTDQIP